MSRLEKIATIACFVLAMLLVAVFFAGLNGSKKNDSLENKNKALQAKNTTLQKQIVALQTEVKAIEQKKARLAKRLIKLENTYWDQRSQISTLQYRVSDLRRGLPFWEANFDNMVSQNVGHQYRQWPFNLSDQLLTALGTMSQFGPEGRAAASWRFTALRAQVESAVKAGLGYGWEKQSLADFQATL